MNRIVTDLKILQGIFAPCAEYTGREVLNKLSQAGMLHETTGNHTGSCPHCSFCQTLEDGSLNCRNLKGLNGKVGSGDRCSRGRFPGTESE